MGTAIYARISKDSEHLGLGVERQLQDCQALVERLGWADDVALYVDNDVSASSGKTRPRYQDLLGDVRGGRVDALVVWDVDRLTRRPAELEDFITLADSHGLRLASVGGEVDLGSPQGRLTARIKGAVARHEVEQQSRRIRRKVEELVAAGMPHSGGLRPFGFTSSRLEVVPEEAELVREAARRVLAGESLRTISKDWTARGVLSVQGKAWSTQSLKNVLVSPRMAALVEHRGKVAGPAVWPAILDRATHEALRHVLLDPARKLKGGDPRGRGVLRFWWSGLMVCGKCGGRMGTTVLTDGRRQWRCLVDVGGCGRTHVNHANVEPLLRRAVISQAPLLQMPDPAQDADRRSTLETAIAGQEARLEGLAVAFAGDDEEGADPMAYRAATRAVRGRLEALRAELAEVVAVESAATARRDLAALAERFDALPVERQRALADTVVERIVIGPGRTGKFDPSRVEIEWRFLAPVPAEEAV